MPIKIEQKIVGWEVVSESEEGVEKVSLNWEPLSRGEEVEGKTYKIKPPVYDEALYVTINHMTLPDGSKRPIEIFVNSKNMQSFQWITALTRVLSALFRQPGDFSFIIDELKQVFDPHGGYFIPGGGGRVDSVVAHIGKVIEKHCIEIGALEKPELSVVQKEYIEEKKKSIGGEAKGAKCSKCGEYTVYVIDGCATCTSCGDSKCG